MILLGDHLSYSRRDKIYGLKGDRVEVIRDDGHFMIVKNKRTRELFSCPSGILATT